MIVLLLVSLLSFSSIWLLISVYPNIYKFDCVEGEHLTKTSCRSLMIVSVILSLISIISALCLYTLTKIFGNHTALYRMLMISSFTLVLASVFANMSVTCLTSDKLILLCSGKSLFNINLSDEFGLGIGFICSGIFGVL